MNSHNNSIAGSLHPLSADNTLDRTSQDDLPKLSIYGEGELKTVTEIANMLRTNPHILENVLGK